MRKVYLTERQYVNYVLLEYTRSGLLNESSINLKKVYQTLYRGCKTFSDFARRTAIIASMGVISFTSLYAIINNVLPVSQEQKQEIIAQIENEDVIPKIEQRIYLNFKISREGIEHIKDYEKCKLEPYFATPKEKVRGIRTIGWGHKITGNDPQWLKSAKSITQEQADAIFAEDIKIYEQEMNEAFKSLPKYLQNTDLYPQGFIDACISIIYNSGRKNFKNSPVFQTLANCRIEKDGTINKDDFAYACFKIKESCTTQNGKQLNGLINRRNTESLMAQN
jgi:GH24 family phage-related lysozyme (muramidase)